MSRQEIQYRFTSSRNHSRPHCARGGHAGRRVGLPRILVTCLKLVTTPCKKTEMAIYGTALLSFCLLVGLIVGRLLGALVGVDANVGGVGIAMLLLVLSCDHLHRSGRLQPPTERGIAFWSSIYIPIVVAMAASQNVLAAIQGGPVAIVAGVLVVIACFALVPWISRIGYKNPQSPQTIPHPLRDE